MTEDRPVEIKVSVSDPGVFRARFKYADGRSGAIAVCGKSWLTNSDPRVTHEMRLRIIEQCEKIIERLQGEYARAVDSVFAEAAVCGDNEHA